MMTKPHSPNRKHFEYLQQRIRKEIEQENPFVYSNFFFRGGWRRCWEYGYALSWYCDVSPDHTKDWEIRDFLNHEWGAS